MLETNNNQGLLDKAKHVKISNIIILIIAILCLFFGVKEYSRYSTSQEMIKVEVLSNKIAVKSVTQINKSHDDIDYVYITFKYGGYIYTDFELGEKKDFQNLKNHDIINLVLRKEYKDDKKTNEYMSIYWHEGAEAKKIN